MSTSISGISGNVSGCGSVSRVLSQWLKGYSPAASRLLSAFVLSPHHFVHTNSQSTTLSSDLTVVKVETLAGELLHVFQCSIDEFATYTVGALAYRVAEKSNASASASAKSRFGFKRGRTRLSLPGSCSPLPPQTLLGNIVVSGSNTVPAKNATPGTDDEANNSSNRQLKVGDEITLIATKFAGVWSRTKSNSHLRFSDQDTAITRPGSRSSYPCGRTDFLLHKPGHSFHVFIRYLPPKANALTIGILSANGTLSNYSSSGVGMSRGSMGIHINNVRGRSKAGREEPLVAVERSWVDPPFRTLEAGDRVSFVVEAPAEGMLQLRIEINHELLCAPPIPPSFEFPFQPLCTLPDDCCLVVE